MATLVWFRDDLRLADNPALHAAAGDPQGVIALYVLDEESEGMRPLGGATKWWLDHSLNALAKALADYGISLILRRGPAAEIVPDLARELGANQVLWNRRYGPARELDTAIKEKLRAGGIGANSHTGDMLFEPWTVLNRTGGPYRVYSPFWRACLEKPAPPRPLPIPSKLNGAEVSVASDPLEAWHLTPKHPNGAEGIASRWVPWEAAAGRTLDEFLEEKVTRYSKRDLPAEEATSELSPYLRWGEISPRTVWHETLGRAADPGLFLSELGWREFAKYTVFHLGPLHQRNLNPKFDSFEWREGAVDEFAAWKCGETGFGIVDAGMRELWQTGFMHNRVRMITASLLTKNLRVDWRKGEAWFWDTLVDADEASNPFNCQWVAGCGADAAPYFRVFNPELQQKKFDPTGAYVRRWAPASDELDPIVDLKDSRTEALAAYHALNN